MDLYILRIDNYGEWAWENGACNIIGVYDNEEMAINELRKNLKMEVEQGYIIDNNVSIDEAIQNISAETHKYIDIYCSKGGYDAGNNLGTYVIEKRKLNDTEGK